MPISTCLILLVTFLAACFAVFAGIALRRLLMTRRRTRRTACIRCGYPIAVHVRCPECGIDPSKARRASRRVMYRLCVIAALPAILACPVVWLWIVGVPGFPTLVLAQLVAVTPRMTTEDSEAVLMTLRTRPLTLGEFEVAAEGCVDVLLDPRTNLKTQREALWLLCAYQTTSDGRAFWNNRFPRAPDLVGAAETSRPGIQVARSRDALLDRIHDHLRSGAPSSQGLLLAIGYFGRAAADLLPELDLIADRLTPGESGAARQSARLIREDLEQAP